MALSLCGGHVVIQAPGLRAQYGSSCEKSFSSKPRSSIGGRSTIRSNTRRTPCQVFRKRGWARGCLAFRYLHSTADRLRKVSVKKYLPAPPNGSGRASHAAFALSEVPDL